MEVGDDKQNLIVDSSSPKRQLPTAQKGENVSRRTFFTLVNVVCFLILSVALVSRSHGIELPNNQYIDNENSKVISAEPRPVPSPSSVAPVDAANDNNNNNSSYYLPSSSSTSSNSKYPPYASIYGKNYSNQQCPNVLANALQLLQKLHSKIASSSSSSPPYQADCAKGFKSSSSTSSSSTQSEEFKNSKTSCADSWLQRCWQSPSSKKNSQFFVNKSPKFVFSDVIHDINKCSSSFMRSFLTQTLRMPRKVWVWRTHGTNLYSAVKSYLVSDDLILKSSCSEIAEVSKYICLAFAHREIDVTFQKSNDEKFLKSATLTDHFSTWNYKFNVLEAFEFREGEGGKNSDATTPDDDKDDEFNRSSTNNNNNSLRQQQQRRRRRITEIDLICVGMFHENISFAADLWLAAENFYFSKFEFRNRHFFQWNSVRSPRGRLTKAARLYGNALQTRMDALRSEVVRKNFRTWLTFDIDSPPADLNRLMELYPQVMILRLLAVSYLLWIDRSFASSSSSTRNKLSDFFVMVRPDLSYHANRLTTIIRHHSTDVGEGIEIVGKQQTGTKTTRKSSVKRIILRGDRSQNLMIGQEIKGSPSTLKQKMTDIFMISNASALIHLYRFLPGVLHSCIYFPFPDNYFVEFYLKLGAQDYHKSNVVLMQLGGWIDRGGGGDGSGGGGAEAENKNYSNLLTGAPSSEVDEPE